MHGDIEVAQAYEDRPVIGTERLHLKCPVAVVGQQTGVAITHVVVKRPSELVDL